MARLNRARSRSRPPTWSFVRMDQTCFGRSGGLAPTIFPLFQGLRLEAASTILKTSVMVTSSASEADHSQFGKLLNSRRLSDDWRHSLLQFDRSAVAPDPMQTRSVLIASLNQSATPYGTTSLGPS